MSRAVGRRRTTLLALAPLLSAALLAGCGDTATPSAQRPVASGSPVAAGSAAGQEGGTAAPEAIGTVRTVACPGAARGLPVPGGVPVPLPRGTVVVDVRHGGDGRTVVTGVVPAAERDVLADVQRAYPAAGLALTEGETEERDAESDFTGTGLTGRWGLRELPDCSPAATRIDLVYRRS